MPILEKIEADFTQAMKEKDAPKVSTLRMLKSALKNTEIQKQKELDEQDIIQVLQSQIKSRHDSIELFKKGDRPELAEKEEKEIAILKEYLPEQMGEDEIRKKVQEIIQKTGAKSPEEMGKVMGQAAQEFKGKADLAQVSQIVREFLQNEN